VAEDVPHTLKWQKKTASLFDTQLVAANPLGSTSLTKYNSSNMIPDYSQNERLPLATAMPVVRASALQQLTQQQALEAAARGKAVVRAECKPARVTLPAPPAMERRYT
jgi:hypothetical protein